MKTQRIFSFKKLMAALQYSGSLNESKPHTLIFFQTLQNVSDFLGILSANRGSRSVVTKN